MTPPTVAQVIRAWAIANLVVATAAVGVLSATIRWAQHVSDLDYGSDDDDE